MSVEIYKSIMSEGMKNEALKVALLALHTKEDKDIARFIKKEFDRKYKPSWNCIVGEDFRSMVSRQDNCYICFSIGDKKILLFKGC